MKPSHTLATFAVLSVLGGPTLHATPSESGSLLPKEASVCQLVGLAEADRVRVCDLMHRVTTEFLQVATVGEANPLGVHTPTGYYVPSPSSEEGVDTVSAYHDSESPLRTKVSVFSPNPEEGMGEGFMVTDLDAGHLTCVDFATETAWRNTILGIGPKDWACKTNPHVNRRGSGRSTQVDEGPTSSFGMTREDAQRVMGIRPFLRAIADRVRASRDAIFRKSATCPKPYLQFLFD